MRKLFQDRVEDKQYRGRGASSNATGRYERLRTEMEHDGWSLIDDETPAKTEIRIDASRTILARNTSPDVPFDRSINPYRGCEHGCIYCFARPTHAQLGLSPGLDFETILTVKPKAAELLDAALRKPGYRVAPIAIGTNTDPYQPIERDHRIMRRVLEVLDAFSHPVTITTKGALVTRDLDILSRMAERDLVRVGISVTTLDHRLGRAMEPRASSPKRRLGAIRELASAGVPVGVAVAPIIPALTDHEIEAILEAASDAGAGSASFIVLRLPLEVSALFQEWLLRWCPDRAARVMARIRETQGGLDYDPTWGKRMKGEGAHAELIAKRFAAASRRLGLSGQRRRLRKDLFMPPPSSGDQLSLGL